mmetsp:Transcript_21324/g.64063  ORF Transcript_21324/g.64063 Transcript_21324/m.64063 type:complete len:277 (-) Transcript_21324:69-899(-)
MAWCASSAEAETCNFAAAAGRCLASSRGANTGAANSVKVDRTEASVCSDLAEPATGSVAWERAERTSEAENLAASCTSRTALGRTSRGGSAASCAGSAGRRIVTRVHVSFVVPGGGMEGVAAPGTRLKKGHASAARALKRPKGSWHSRPAATACAAADAVGGKRASSGPERGDPESSCTRHAPSAQTSIFGVCGSPRATSGEASWGVPHFPLRWSASKAHQPKSHNRTRPRESRSRFSSLMSRWIRPRSCRWATPMMASRSHEAQAASGATWPGRC